MQPAGIPIDKCFRLWQGLELSTTFPIVSWDWQDTDASWLIFMDHSLAEVLKLHNSLQHEYE